MAKIQLLFYRGVGLPGLLVRLWTRSRFAHVAIRVDDGVYEALAPRVIKREYSPLANDALTQRRGDAKATAVELPADCDLAKAPQMLAFLAGAVGDAYDWRAIGMDVAGRLMPAWVHLIDASRSDWDCSRLAATAIGILGWDDAAAVALCAPISPGDLFRMLQKEGKR